jgi:6,7-dimethyl-8-ribityllumazine synthase
MPAKKKNLSKKDNAKIPSAAGYSFGIVRSKWNGDITNSLAEACTKELIQCGSDLEHICQIDVPGAFELPAGVKLLAQNKKLDAIICIGCVIKGETLHNEYINHAVVTGITQFTLTTGIPVIYGVLTPNNYRQAEERSGGKHGNKGIEAAVTAIEMACLARKMKNTDRKIGFGL